MSFITKKTHLSADRISYLLYSKKSFAVDYRSYTVLFLAIVCMVVMSCNMIIYSASLSKGENDTVIKEFGEYHLCVEGIDNVLNMKLNAYGNIKASYDIPIVGSYINPNTESSFKAAKLGVYSENMTGLYIEPVRGEFPGLNEIMISEKISRAFSLTVGDNVNIKMVYGGIEKNVSLHVSGIFKGCAATDEYIFTSQQTGDAILDYKYSYEYVSYDKYILFDTKFKPYIIKYTDKILNDVGNVPLVDENGYSLRENYMNNEYVQLKEFYQKESFLITMLVSVLPAAVCILVFSFLDVSKSMKELSTLSMIGTTSKQFFMILMSKYTAIYAVGFPIGVLISAVTVFIISLFSKGLNTDHEIYFSYTVSPVAILVLFVLCYAVICGLTFFVAKNTTSTSYSDSLSVMKDMNNIFVRNTSSVLLKPRFKKIKLGLTFFARNRKANAMFCSVVGIIFAVFFYFSIIISQNIGNTVVQSGLSDYSFTPDTLVTEKYTTVRPSAIEKLHSVSGVSKVTQVYKNSTSVNIFLNGHKHMSKPNVSSVNTLEKRLNVDVLMFCEEYDQAEKLYSEYVRSGSLYDVYKDGSVALFVHTWGNSKEYFHAGDTVKLSKTGSETQFDDYKIGAVIYIESDEYENIDVVRILTNRETFTEFTGQSEPNSVGIILDDSVGNEIEDELAVICKEESLEMTNNRAQYSDELKKMKSSVIFYGLLWLTVCIIMIALPFSLSKFLLRSRRSTVYTMHMIGYGRKELSGIFSVEFVISGVLSAIVGTVLSFLLLILYKKASQIMYIPYYSNTYTDAVLFISALIGVLIVILIPCLSSFVYFMRSQFKDNK